MLKFGALKGGTKFPEGDPPVLFPKKTKPKPEAKPVKKEADDVTAFDIRVGKIVSVKKHDTADTLYVEKVDLGEGEPRQIVSGLVNHVPVDKMQVWRGRERGAARARARLVSPAGCP